MTMTTTTTEAPDPLEPPVFATRIATPEGEGEFYIWQPAPGVVIEKAVGGIYSLPMVEQTAAFCCALFAEGGPRLRLFIDVEHVARYTRDARDAMTAFTIEYRAGIEAIHILLASRTIALGVSAYKHIVGDSLIRTTSDRASFRRSVEDALRG
jgi:hypothetical protein